MDDLIREMITPRSTGLDPARRRRLAATAVTVALAAAGVTSLTTGAIFTDTETMAATDFTTGTVQIEPSMSTTIALGSGNMAPGDTSYGLVTVENAGSLAQRYAVSVRATNDQPTVDLAGELELAVYAAGAAACTPAGVAGLTPLATRDGLPLIVTPLVGSPTTGPQAGDRTLSTASSETLCVTVSLPLGTTNEFQGAGAQVAFTFDAEQTANNG